jgi:hypothetical protein
LGEFLLEVGERVGLVAMAGTSLEYLSGVCRNVE